MKQLTPSKYANLYLNAAIQLGLNYRIVNRKASHADIFNTDKSIRLESHKLDLNTAQGADRAKNKEITSLLLQKRNIPVPTFRVFEDRAKALVYALGKLKEHASIVIKPSNCSNAVGIRINPTTQRQVTSAIQLAFKASKKVIIEEYISGHHYRVTVLDGEIIAVTQRLPAYVMADGQLPLRELIEQKNILRAKGKLPLIVLRDRDNEYLQSARICLSKIYSQGTSIRLHHGCDYEVGGERVKIDIQSIPKINQTMFVRAIRALHLRFGGIDYISPDITIPYAKMRTAINEINNSPHQDVHYFDSYPHDNYAAKRIIQKIFE